MFLKKVVMHLIIASMIFPPGTQIAFAQRDQSLPNSPVADGTVQYELYQSSADRMTRFVRDLQSHLDRTTFDFDALLDSLSYDAEEIIEFSKTAIAYEQYPGVLRGPRGTLFSRAGNSIDQALFLAKLLRDAGYDARVVGASLDEQQAHEVLRAMKQPVLPPPPVGDAEGFLGVFTKYGLLDSALGAEQEKSYRNYISSEPAAPDTATYQAVLDTTDFIQRQFDKRGVSIGRDGSDSDLVDEASDYHWVQYKDNASDPWTDVHPIFQHEPFAQSPNASVFINSDVPKELQHRLRLQVFIERKVGDRLETAAITAPWERPVANLVGVPLTFSNVANTMLSEDAVNSTLQSSVVSATSFVPTFGQVMAPGARFFDLSGTLIDPMAMAGGASGLFATINSAFGDAIGDIGSEQLLPTLTAQWLQIDLISPDGTETSYRRTTFDRVGAAKRSANQVPADLEPTTAADVKTLIQRHTIMVDTGGIPRGYLANSAGQHFESSRPAIDATLDISFERPARSRNLSAVPVGWPGHPTLFALFNQARSASDNHRIYRSGPAVVIHSEGLGSADTFSERIDIVNNPRRAIEIMSELPKPDPAMLVQAGVWETAAEGVLQSGAGEFNTWTAFEKSARDGRAPVLLLPENDNPSVDLAPDTWAAVNADLARGYAVLIPDPVTKTERAGWWRIDLRTGQTLWQIDDGRGAETVEYAVGLMISVAFLLLGAEQCKSAAGDGGQMEPEEFCCHMANGGMAFLTMAVGLWLIPIAGIAGIGAGAAMDSISYMQPYTGQICEELLEDDSIF